MNLIEKGDILERGYNDLAYTVLKPSEMTVCLAKYLTAIFPRLKSIACGYTRHTDFYKNAGVISEFINSLKLCRSEEFFVLDAVDRKLFTNQIGFTHKQLLKELFYCIRLGTAYNGIPSSLVFYLKECFDSEYIFDTYSINVIPKAEFEELASGQLGDPIQIISKIRGRHTQILYASKSYVIENDRIEFYIASTDCVAAAPKSLLEHVPLNKLNEVNIERGVLCFKGKPLHSYCAKQGFYSGSIYDLVNCI